MSWMKGSIEEGEEESNYEEWLQKERDGSKVGEGMGIRQGWSRHVGRGINSMSRNQDGRGGKR